MSIIVGISAHFHDSACCLICDGELIAAVQEERFSRQKYEHEMPKAAFRYCLRQAGATVADVDLLAYYENPTLKLGRQLWMGLPRIPPSHEESLFRLDAMRPIREIREILGYEGKVHFVEHHEAHAASSYYFSGFDEAAILTVDGVGEWTTTAYGCASGNDLSLFEQVSFPHSLGLLYSAITSYLGFGVNDGEYKVMGLAPYGVPRFLKQIRSLIQTESGGQYRLDMRYFDFLQGHKMYSDNMIELLGCPPRERGAEISDFSADLASSLQTVLEEILLEKVHYLHTRAPSENLCLAGGVALNCVANSRVLQRGPFRQLFVPPAAGDAGGALGAAALAARQLEPRRRMRMLDHAYVGPEFGDDEIAAAFAAGASGVKDYRGEESALLSATTDRLAAGAVVGWFQGRMEFGPRALGARSILADPRVEGMRDRINQAVKKRESFRPFAPAVVSERANEFFAIDHESPFMLEVFDVRCPALLPAVTHVDGSARVQTVTSAANPRFHRLLEEFGRRTGCPVLVNTSFNIRDEPIVCTPYEALLCFLRSEMDCVVIEDFLVDRDAVPKAWLEWFEGSVPQPRSLRNEILYTFL